MIRVSTNGDDNYIVEMGFRAPTIYLDHWAIRKISGNPTWQARFLAAFHKKEATLFFSSLNIIELGRNTGQSLVQAGEFLAAIDTQWCLLDAGPHRVIEKEYGRIQSPLHPCFDERLLELYYPQIHSEPLKLSKITKLVEGQKHRYENIYNNFLEEASHIEAVRLAIKNDHPHINKDIYPIGHFDPEHPTKYVYHSLMRKTLNGGKTVTRNDVCDIMHASVSLAYADFVLLDGHWCDLAKQSLKVLPNAQRVFKESEMEGFLTTLEKCTVA